MNKKELKRIGKVIKWLIDALEPDKLDHKTWFVMGAAVQILNKRIRKYGAKDKMTDVYEQLNRIEERLERIEDLLLENTQEDNNRLDIKETKELMQDICKFYIEHTPIINIVERTRLHLFRFRESICSIKNIDNNKWQRRKIMKYINKLEQYQFITKVSSDTYQVLSTGASWWDMEEPISK